MLKIAEFGYRKKALITKTQEILCEAGIDCAFCGRESKCIRLVFAGQYNVGKSSIVKVLTGREDIAIGNGITTQHAQTYAWNGLEIVDTPGIHTERRPDHDEISYEAIATADILVFVVSSELFDSHIGEHFRKLAIDRDKASEMILVVNKMNRTQGGNSLSQQNIIREDLRKVLSPYTPEQVHLSFLDAELCLKGVKEREIDAEYADELFALSGYADFITTLNQFVSAKGLSSQLTTDLYVLDEQLENVIKNMQPQSLDMELDALEESLIQQRHLLIEARGNMQQEAKDIYLSAASQIRDIGRDAANQVFSGCNQEEVEENLARAIKKAEDIIEKSQTEAIEMLDARLNSVGRHLENIECSEFSMNLKARLIKKMHGLPEGIQRIITAAGPGAQKAGKTVVDSAYKNGVHGGLKLTNFSGSKIHQGVLKVGHKIGYSFKPWQALKVTKGLVIGGQVLSVLGVGLSVFMQIKADRDEEADRKLVKKNQQNIRSQFNAAASGLENHGRQFIKDNVTVLLRDSIATIDASIQEIRGTRLDRSTLCQKIEELQKECRQLIQEIHLSDYS